MSSFQDYVENSQIEKKLFSKSLDFKHKIRKSIAAFANTNGGKILLGAPDAKHTSMDNRPADGIPGDIEIGTWLDGTTASSQLMIPAPNIQVEPLEYNKIPYALITIKRAALPIGVRKESDRPLEYYKRGNQSIVPFNFEDFIDGFNTQRSRDARTAYAAIWMALTAASGYRKTVEALRNNHTSFNLFSRCYDVLFANYSLFIGLVTAQEDLNQINRLINITKTIEENFDAHNDRVSRNVQLGNYDENLEAVEKLVDEAEKAAQDISIIILRENKELKKMLNEWLKKDRESKDRQSQPTDSQISGDQENASLTFNHKSDTI